VRIRSRPSKGSIAREGGCCCAAARPGASHRHAAMPPAAPAIRSKPRRERYRCISFIKKSPTRWANRLARGRHPTYMPPPNSSDKCRYSPVNCFSGASVYFLARTIRVMTIDAAASPRTTKRVA
jgi:hypothetical protein